MIKNGTFVFEIYMFLNGTYISACAEGWVRYKDSCYYLSTARLHFKKAKDKCTLMGSVVTTVDSAEENAFIRKLGG